MEASLKKGLELMIEIAAYQTELYVSNEDSCSFPYWEDEIREKFKSDCLALWVARWDEFKCRL